MKPDSLGVETQAVRKLASNVAVVTTKRFERMISLNFQSDVNRTEPSKAVKMWFPCQAVLPGADCRGNRSKARWSRPGSFTYQNIRAPSARGFEDGTASGKTGFPQTC